MGSMFDATPRWFSERAQCVPGQNTISTIRDSAVS